MHTEVEQTEINEALAATLADDKFAAAPQMSAFLKYVVEQTLQGHANRIKAYTVAIDALGKPTTFDPQNDPSVRVLAKRLRSSLEAYYERTANPGVIIEMKAGSYVPKFVFTTHAAENQSASNNIRQLHSTPVSPVHSGSNVVGLEPVPQALAPTARVSSIVPNGDPQSAPEPPAAAAPCPINACSDTSEINPKPNVAVPDSAATEDQHTENPEITMAGENPFWRKLGNIPRPAVAITVLVASVWAFTGDKQNTSPEPTLATARDGDTVSTQDVVPPFRIELANNQQSQPTHTRPALPTVSILSNPDGDKLQAQLANTISSVISHFDNVQVVRSNAHSAYAMHWPEEYRLQMSSMVVDNQIRIDVQLLQTQTGQVTYPGTFMLSKAANDHLSASELESVEEFAANVAQMNGPLMRDYQARGDYTPDMACLFELQGLQQAQTLRKSSTETGQNPVDPKMAENTNNLAATSSNCTTNADTASDTQRLVHEASARLADIDNLPARIRKDRLRSAITLSRQAITQSPQYAEAHSVLMTALQRAGETDEAIEHGRHSLKLNPYSGNVLRSLADLLELKSKTIESKSLRNRATRYDPFSVPLNPAATS